ncbi:TetR/AcrR family transcriptional regulator [Shewanella sp. Scap07]|uniref:TetR/AcrR family transcriptional regulator n=1 Tax=Shewanella sp. Scap07 TaxID=2589987 RepID=UPI0015BBBCC8|nr:TetR/AcrR family transcriptional regulator [Shewanella sp. Scap07]QLE84133.1 TetR/AcrR family transcriptional regulator [Shewanella sp. Scap07]
MPKIVDHNEKRLHIAMKATEIFLQQGYKNVGMRQLCEYLGMSKSAVYHYYKSKDELFIAATEAIINYDASAFASPVLTADATRQQRVDNFISLFAMLAPRFFQEMKLVADYMEVIGLDNVSDDPCMNIANDKYLRLLSDYVSAEHSAPLYTLLLGLLNHQLMLGKPLEPNYIAEQVGYCLAQPS